VPQEILLIKKQDSIIEIKPFIYGLLRQNATQFYRRFLKGYEGKWL